MEYAACGNVRNYLRRFSGVLHPLRVKIEGENPRGEGKNPKNHPESWRLQSLKTVATITDSLTSLSFSSSHESQWDANHTLTATFDPNHSSFHTSFPLKLLSTLYLQVFSVKRTMKLTNLVNVDPIHFITMYG